LRFYNLLLPLAFVLMLPGLLRRMLRRGNYRENFGQRFGRYGESERERFGEGRWVWIHSISVGETLVALKLARALREQDPGVCVALSVTTSTGFALARQQGLAWVEVLYNPVDFPGMVGRALDLIRPERLIFIEGETWPNLVAEAARRGIGMALVNARMSPRSEARFRRRVRWVAPLFGQLDWVCVAEVEDVALWRGLGARPEVVRHTGSLKFDLGIGHSGESGRLRGILESVGVEAGAPVLVAGSTWAPEERVLAGVLLRLRGRFPKLFLVLVPRHVERTSELARELEGLGLRVARRSMLGQRRGAPCDVLLVDTTGELRSWYEVGEVAFVGKSLPGVGEAGGQNPAEPAALSRPVVFGPHMENFGPVVGRLLAGEGAVQVVDAAGLEEVLGWLLGDAGARERIGARAGRALEPHQGAAQRCASLLLGRE